MNRRLANVWALLCLAALAQPLTATAQTPKVETIAEAAIKAGAADFKGSIQEAELSEDEAPKAPLFKQYGTRTETADYADGTDGERRRQAGS